MEYGFIVTNDVLAQKAKDVRPEDIPFRQVQAPRQVSATIVLRTDSDSLPVMSFGKAEIEGNAGRLVRFFQSKGGWGPFTLVELKEFYVSRGWRLDGDILFGLDKDWSDWAGKYRGNLVRKAPKKQLAVTDVFILWSAGRSEEVRAVWDAS